MEKKINNVNYLTVDHLLGAAVRAGRDKGRNGDSCGDSLLIDLENNFFAVADSTERAPSASRAFLEKVRALLKNHGLHGSESTDSNRQVKEFVSAVNASVAEVTYTDNTTFTGLFFDARTQRVVLLHNGDSICYHFRVAKERGEKISQTNHCFVGRVHELNQTRHFEYAEDSRFLLATDGFYDLVRNLRRMQNGGMEQTIMELMRERSADQIPEAFIGRYDLCPEMSDDLGMIVLNPGVLCNDHKTNIIM